MPCWVCWAACWLPSSRRAATRNWLISALLDADSSCRIEDWFRIACGVPVVSSSMEELKLPCM